METITCILQKRSLEAVKTLCDKRVKWGLTITAKSYGTRKWTVGVGVEERFGDCLGYLGCDWAVSVFLGGERVRKVR